MIFFEQKLKLIAYPLIILAAINLVYFHVPLVPKRFPIMCAIPPCGEGQIVPITTHKYTQQYICLKKGYACNDRILNGPEVSWEHNKLYIPANIILFVLISFLVFLIRKPNRQEVGNN
jgi:hypothetical protein